MILILILLCSCCFRFSRQYWRMILQYKQTRKNWRRNKLGENCRPLTVSKDRQRSVPKTYPTPCFFQSARRLKMVMFVWGVKPGKIVDVSVSKIMVISVQRNLCVSVDKRYIDLQFHTLLRFEFQTTCIVQIHRIF